MNLCIFSHSCWSLISWFNLSRRSGWQV